MSWKDGKRNQALTKLALSDKWYDPNKDALPEAVYRVLSGPYGEKLLYVMYQLADKPLMKLADNSPYAAVAREAKRDLIDQLLRMANSETIEGETE